MRLTPLTSLICPPEEKLAATIHVPVAAEINIRNVTVAKGKALLSQVSAEWDRAEGEGWLATTVISYESALVFRLVNS